MKYQTAPKMPSLDKTTPGEPVPDPNALLKRSVNLVREFGTVNMNLIHGPSHWRNVGATGVYLL